MTQTGLLRFIFQKAPSPRRIEEVTSPAKSDKVHSHQLNFYLKLPPLIISLISFFCFYSPLLMFLSRESLFSLGLFYGGGKRLEEV